MDRAGPGVIRKRVNCNGALRGRGRNDDGQFGETFIQAQSLSLFLYGCVCIIRGILFGFTILIEVKY